MISNHVKNLKLCKHDIQERMLLHFTLADPEYGRRVAEGIGLPVPDMAAQPVGDEPAGLRPTDQRSPRSPPPLPISGAGVHTR